MAKRGLIPDGKISRAVREGLKLRRQMLDDGMPELEVDRIIGAGLKAAWGDSTQTERTDPWHYYCEKCSDTGWQEVKPTYTEQKRIARLYGDDGQAQPYYQKCDPCRFMERERENRRRRVGDMEGLAAAGQTKRTTKRF